jgi:septal ring-binding cell division protein DamX
MQIDHINGDSTDNRWNNLRLATHSENQWNRTRINKNNTTGLTGAYYNQKRRENRRWYSQLENKFLGSFATKEEAHEAYKKAVSDKYGIYLPDRLKS